MTGEPLQLLGEWARLLLGSFADAGVRDVVVSPGSRSTPFVLAAARESRLRCHDVIDERSAAFFALGQARATGRPSLLVCTSGSAGAHYFPAIVEAAQAGVPLLVLTADRPFELQDCHAPQTIDQTKLFGDHVRRFVELGVPDGSLLSLRAMRRRAVQAVHDAMSPRAGPVHLNARARKPLEPGAARDEAEREVAKRVARLLSTPAPTVIPASIEPRAEAVERLRMALGAAERPILVAGPAPLAQGDDAEDILSFAAAAGVPLFCEATSQLRFRAAVAGVVVGDATELLLASTALRETPIDLIVQLGAPPTASAWEPFLAAHERATHVVVAPHGWNDPTSSADLLVMADVGATARALRPLVANHGPAWGAQVARATRAAWDAVARVVDVPGPLSEALVARTVVKSLPPVAVLAIGNSLPIRHLDGWCPASLGVCGVVSQRGANGIDGLVSGAAGLASTGRTTVLLVGDTSFLHDLGGLAAARHLDAPLVIVIIENGGGRIFEQLPVARAGLRDGELLHFTTPHELTFAPAAALFGLSYAAVSTGDALEDALRKALQKKACTVIEAMVPASGAAPMRVDLLARADAAISAAWGGP